MKKILVVLLSLIFTFSLFGCEKIPRPSSEPEKESVSESVYEEPTDPIIACGTVNLADEIAVFSQIFDNDFVNITANLQAPIGGEYHDLVVTLNARRTYSGYDVIIVGDLAGWRDTEVVVPYFRVWYVGGYYAYEIAEGPSVGDMAFESGKGLTFNQFVSLLNEKIYQDDGLRLAYQAFKPEIANNFKGFVSSQGGKSLSGLYGDFLKQVEEYKNRPVYDFIVEGLIGLKLADGEKLQTLENQIIEICSGNPSLAVFVDRAIALINGYLPVYAQIDLKGTVDSLQTALGLTTAEIIANLKAQNPDIESLLRSPKDGETLYDYIRSFLRLISMDMLAQQFGGGQDATFDLVAKGLIEKSKQVTLADFIATLPTDIDAWVETVDEKYRQTVKDIVAQIKNYIDGKESVIPRGDAVAQYSLLVDESGRPVAFGCRVDAQLYPNESLEGLENGLTYYAGLTVELNYEDQGAKFEIPSLGVA